MNPADKRMMELLEKWLISLELHLRYADLPDAAYLSVQPWPTHDRPTRWILELAKQKVLELKGQQESRIEMGDGKFAESLELMGFLANLVGLQHVQRFIPLAEPGNEVAVPPDSRQSATSASTVIKAPGQPRQPSAARAAEAEATREMPRVAASTPPAGKVAASPARTAAPSKPASKPIKKSLPAATATGKGNSSVAMQKKVMTDAVRLLSWGKEWHELAELIARIADRPPVAEVRRILRSHKAEIEMQAEGED